MNMDAAVYPSSDSLLKLVPVAVAQRRVMDDIDCHAGSLVE
jgi:hypothetical protein